MRIFFISLRSGDLGLSSRLRPIAAELRTPGHGVAFASPAPAVAKLIPSAGFRDLERPQMYASGFPGFPDEPALLVCGCDHFLALLGWCDHVGRVADPGTVRRSCGHGPGTSRPGSRAGDS